MNRIEDKKGTIHSELIYFYLVAVRKTSKKKVQKKNVQVSVNYLRQEIDDFFSDADCYFNIHDCGSDFNSGQIYTGVPCVSVPHFALHFSCQITGQVLSQFFYIFQIMFIAFCLFTVVHGQYDSYYDSDGDLIPIEDLVPTQLVTTEDPPSQNANGESKFIF